MNSTERASFVTVNLPRWSQTAPFLKKPALRSIAWEPHPKWIDAYSVIVSLPWFVFHASIQATRFYRAAISMEMNVVTGSTASRTNMVSGAISRRVLHSAMPCRVTSIFVINPPVCLEITPMVTTAGS